MTSSVSLTDPRAYHILSYGTFLGVTFFQSFVGGVVAYKVLPRPQFSRLQEATFPVFFSLQTALPLLMIFTYPGKKLFEVAGKQARSETGYRGVLADDNRWSVLVPMATILATSVANLLFVGPATTKCMKERKHQETRDGKKSYDAGPQSNEMQKLNSRFATLHSVSTILNLIGYAYSIYYGFVLAEGL